MAFGLLASAALIVFGAILFATTGHAGIILMIGGAIGFVLRLARG
jgi:hypothetical protein